MSKATDIPPLNCRYSKHPCGTDTRMVGDPCPCVSCQYHEEHERFRAQLAERTRERDEALPYARAIGSVESLLGRVGMLSLDETVEAVGALLTGRDDARAEVGRLREALEEIRHSGPDDGYRSARIARHALAKEGDDAG